MSLQDELRAKREATERWIRHREADLKRGASVLEANGRKAYGDAIRTGRDVLARTPSELRALGLAAVQGRLPQALAGQVVRSVPTALGKARSTVDGIRAQVGEPGSRKRDQFLKDAKEQGRAAASGFVDEATFGLADRALSAGEALLEGDVARFGDRYSDNMATRRAADEYDAQQYGTARTVGRVAGLGTGVAVLGAPGVVRGAVSLLPKGAELVKVLTTSRYALDPRGLTVMAGGGGAAAGVASQAVSDVLSHEPSSWRDYAGAAIGGAVDGVATLRAGPVVGGALGGLATSAMQNGLSGREIVPDDLLDSARTSALLGGLFGAGGAYGASRAPTRLKGQMGEVASRAKTIARGDGIPFGAGERFYLDEGYTVPDLQFRTRKPGKLFGIGEAKMGPTAELTKRQLQAQARSDIDYVVDGWRYVDMGRAAGAAGSALGAQYENDRQLSWLPR